MPSARRKPHRTSVARWGPGRQVSGLQSTSSLWPCHPERSVSIREANRHTQSKDPYVAGGAGSGEFWQGRRHGRGGKVCALAVTISRVPAAEDRSEVLL